MVTDQNKTVVWKAYYRPFGEVDEVISTVDMKLRFSGQYADAETGLNYNYFRSYNPAIGRYTQSDPIGLYGGLNTYNYVSGNPIRAFDEFGLFKRNACSLLDVVFGDCSAPSEMPEDTEELFKKLLEEACSKGCDKIVSECKRALGPGCYMAGTPCLVPCGKLEQECKKKVEEECDLNDEYACYVRDIGRGNYGP